MSDAGMAPSAPVSAPASPPSQSQVPIDPAPTSSPQPIGSQAPARGDDGPVPSRREAIQRAFARSRDPEWQKTRPGPAEAKKGHNQPPEPTPDDVAEKPRLNLKKRPDEQEPEPQPRDRGRFAPRQAQPGPGAGVRAGQSGQPGQPGQQGYVNPLPQHAPYREPPTRMANHAKSEWHTAPESVRGEVYRMHREFAAAHQRYQNDHAQMNAIRPYHEMARRHGTTLQSALSNYTSIENKLRSDPIGGLDLIVNNLNLRTSDGYRLTLRDIANYVVNQSPEQLRAVQHSNAQQSSSQQINQLYGVIRQLAQNQQRMQYDTQFRHTRGAVNRFAETHPRLDELGPLIERELKFGFDLPTAYRRAELLKPATHAAQTRSPSGSDRSNRSISGAPSGGSPNSGASNTQRANGKVPSRRDAIASAIRRVNGSL